MGCGGRGWVLIEGRGVMGEVGELGEGGNSLSEAQNAHQDRVSFSDFRIFGLS